MLRWESLGGRLRRAILSAWIATWAAIPTTGAFAEDIKIGLFRSVLGAPLYIGVEKGYFVEEGLSAKLVFFEAGLAIPTAVLSGDVDVGVTAMTGSLFNLAGRGALRIIGGYARSMPGFAGWALVESNKAYASGLRSYGELPGRSFAGVGIGGPTDYVLARLGEKYGFTLQSLKRIPLQTNASVVSAIIGGTADFAIMTPTAIMPSVARGDTRLMGQSGEELPPLQGGVLFTAARTADERQPMVGRFLRAYQKGAQEYYDAFTAPGDTRRDGPTASEVIATIGKYVPQSVEELRAAVGYIDPQARVDVADVLHQVAFFKSQGMLKGEIDADAIIDKRYVIPLPGR